MATSEIEKLERRYAENPQGLTFAPLAEVHRKSGDVARALELLRAGLELHPNYIPASIVLGRCHWDLGDLPAAESAFAHVLRLDDENVIALKSLADINERLERFGEAQRWLYRLVSVDRSNDEARQQLNRLETAGAPGIKADDGKRAAPDLPQEVVAAHSAAPDVKSTEVALKQPVDVKPTEAGPKQPVADEIGSLDLTAAIAEPESGSEPPEAAVAPPEPKSPALEFLDTSGEEKPAKPEESAPLTGLINQELPPDKIYRLHPELTQGFKSAKEDPDRLDVELEEDVELRSSGAAEFRMPNAAEDFMDLAARMNAARAELPPTDPPLPATMEVSQPPAAEGAPHPLPAPAPPTPARPEAVSSETVAETTEPSYSARDTKGQSVASFFEALLAARPPGNSGPPAASPSSAASEPGASTSPAQDALSLSSVFGGETVPIPPAVPAAGQEKDAAVSFDDFFGSPAGGSRPLPQGSTDPGTDDLDQFQSWLQNLKR